MEGGKFIVGLVQLELGSFQSEFNNFCMSRGATGELAKLFMFQAGGVGTIPTLDGGGCPDAVLFYFYSSRSSICTVN